MESLNSYGPWALTLLSVLTAAGTLLKPRLQKSAPSPTTPMNAQGLLTAAGGLPGLMNILANLPAYIEDLRRIAAAITAILDALNRALPQPPKQPQ